MSVNINKPIKLIAGDIGNKLAIGNSAAIYCEDGRIIITSPVEHIRDRTNYDIEIETRNTIYRLILMDANKQWVKIEE